MASTNNISNGDLDRQTQYKYKHTGACTVNSSQLRNKNGQSRTYHVKVFCKIFFLHFWSNFSYLFSNFLPVFGYSPKVLVKTRSQQLLWRASMAKSRPELKITNKASRSKFNNPPGGGSPFPGTDLDHILYKVAMLCGYPHC